MEKFFLLPFVKNSFNTTELINTIKRFNNFDSWNVKKIDTIGDRGVLLHIKQPNFVGFILLTMDCEQITVRKVNKCGMVLLTNHTKYSSILNTIFTLYLAD